MDSLSDSLFVYVELSGGGHLVSVASARRGLSSWSSVVAAILFQRRLRGAVCLRGRLLSPLVRCLQLRSSASRIVDFALRLPSRGRGVAAGQAGVES